MSRPLVIKMTPRGKPRMTQRDKWAKRPCVVRYFERKDFFKQYVDKAKEKMSDGTLDIEFYIPMPKSWSKKKKLEFSGKPHQQKCDIDNICKEVMDFSLENDSVIWKLSASKYWAMIGDEIGCIIIN